MRLKCVIKMILAKIIVTIWKIIFIFLILEGDPSSADPGADFLSAVIEQLKQEKFPNNYAVLPETMVAGTRRSVQDYQINESPVSGFASLRLKKSVTLFVKVKWIKMRDERKV